MTSQSNRSLEKTEKSYLVFAGYDTLEDAHNAIAQLREAGFDAENIGFASNDVNESFRRMIDEDIVDAEEGAGIGAVTGSILGLVLGLISVTLPGAGTIAVAGPLAVLGSGAAGSGIGAAVGAASGGLVGQLLKMGVDQKDADFYAELLRRGGVIVSVAADVTGANEAAKIMHEHNPVDLDHRRKQWAQAGWEHFEPMDPPYSAEQIHDEWRMNQKTRPSFVAATQPLAVGYPIRVYPMPFHPSMPDGNDPDR